MGDEIRVDWSSLLDLLPACMEFREQALNGEETDLHEVADRVGAAFGISDVDAFAANKVRDAMQDGFAEGLNGPEAKALAGLFASSCKPIMSLVVQFARGGMSAPELLAGMNDVCFGNVSEMQAILQKGLGVPDKTAEFLAGKLGPYLVSVYAFAAAYKIYAKAAKDAELARERRIKIERLANESIAQLQAEREEMERFVDACLLDKLQPFSEGITAMDQAVIDSDDDGYIAANAQLWELFGRKAQYATADEFDDLMQSDEVFRL